MSQTQVNSLDKHDGSKHKANATASKIVQKEMATVKSMNNSIGSKDNTNVTTSNVSSKVVQTEVTSYANTSKMVQKEMITENVKTRKKDVLSTQETSLLGTSSQLESQENIHNTHSTNVLEIKCILYTINMNNCVAYGTIHLSTGKQSIHGVPLQDNCYRVSIDKVVKEAAFLPVESCEVKTVGDALNTFVAWPKYLVTTSQKIPNLSSIQTQNTTIQVAKKQKMCFTTLDGIKKQGARRTRKTL
ncbi:putative transposase, Tnp1/En/Spm [Helianthus debilis subsp. tardiflorus]